MMSLPTKLLNRITASTRQVLIDKHIVVGKAENWVLVASLVIEKGGAISDIDRKINATLDNKRPPFTCQIVICCLVSFSFFGYHLRTHAMTYISSSNSLK